MAKKKEVSNPRQTWQSSQDMVVILLSSSSVFSPLKFQRQKEKTLVIDNTFCSIAQVEKVISFSVIQMVR